MYIYPKMRCLIVANDHAVMKWVGENKRPYLRPSDVAREVEWVLKLSSEVCVCVCVLYLSLNWNWITQQARLAPCGTSCWATQFSKIYTIMLNFDSYLWFFYGFNLIIQSYFNNQNYCTTAYCWESTMIRRHGGSGSRIIVK